MKTAAKTAEIVYDKPVVEDGAAMWKLVNESTLDQNSPYKYIMMCEFFQETCVTAKENGELVGFVTAFIPPEKPDVIFVWQIGIGENQRGKGIATGLLRELTNRTISDDVRYLEATVTPTNEASKALFKGFADKNDVTCTVAPCFDKNLFPGDDHEEELTYRIGPLDKQ